MTELLSDERPGEWHEVAFARDEAEAGLLKGMLEDNGIGCVLVPHGLDGALLGHSLLRPRSYRVTVHPTEADRARRLLEEMTVDPSLEAPEVEDLLAARSRRGPRNYGLLGAHARALFWSLAAMALAFAIFILSRGL